MTNTIIKTLTISVHSHDALPLSYSCRMQPAGLEPATLVMKEEVNEPSCQGYTS